MNATDKTDIPRAIDRFDPTSRRRRLIQIVQNTGLLAVLLLGILIMSFASPVFMTRINLENLLFAATVVAVVAIGQSFVILIAGIDLSAGAVLALASVLSVGLVGFYDLPVGLAAVIALGSGLLIGIVNGLSVTWLRIPPLIATLAMMSIARGIAFLFSGGRTITPVPDIYVDIQQSRLLGIPVVILGTLLLALAAHLVLSRTRFGREVYATGGNAVAARLAGIDTRWMTLKIFALMGMLSGLAAVIASARLNSATNALGTLDELYVIAAAVIGGTSLAGGLGTIYGAILGALVMQSLQSGMVLIGFDSAIQRIVVGLVLVLAVYLDNLYRKKVK